MALGSSRWTTASEAACAGFLAFRPHQTRSVLGKRGTGPKQPRQYGDRGTLRAQQKKGLPINIAGFSCQMRVLRRTKELLIQ
ncbi:hypothetical protein SBBP1_390026 [Burkholderiales bacterium]|nr:hypothetical protein SBBP1_390026 [Burkholderiales bacterium]